MQSVSGIYVYIKVHANYLVQIHLKIYVIVLKNSYIKTKPSDKLQKPWFVVKFLVNLCLCFVLCLAQKSRSTHSRPEIRNQFNRHSVNPTNSTSEWDRELFKILFEFIDSMPYWCRDQFCWCSFCWNYEENRSWFKYKFSSLCIMKYQSSKMHW